MQAENHAILVLSAMDPTVKNYSIGEGRTGSIAFRRGFTNPFFLGSHRVSLKRAQSSQRLTKSFLFAMVQALSAA